MPMLGIICFFEKRNRKKVSGILIAGAGYGGLTAAINLAKKGLFVTVVEEKQECEAGHDWHDSFDINAFEKSGISVPDSDMYRNAKYHGYINPSASSAKITLPSKESTIVMDRRILTSYLIECAKEVGVTFRFGEKICSPIVNQNNRVRGVVTQKDGRKHIYESDLLIDSAGMYSPVRSNLPQGCGIQKGFDEKNIFHIFRAYYKNSTGEVSQPSYLINLFHLNRPGIDWTSGNKEYVDVLIGKFGTAGKLSQQDVDDALNDYRKNYPYIDHKTIRGGIFADIPLTKMLPLIVCDGYAAVGDSAGMVQPLNGCGIALSMQAGKILADAVAGSKGHYTKETLWKYQYEYFCKFGKSLVLLNKIKDLCLHVRSKDIDALLESDIVNMSIEQIINSGKINLNIRNYLKILYSLPQFSSLFLPFCRSLFCMPFLMMAILIMPEKYDAEKVKKWMKIYEKI